MSALMSQLNGDVLVVYFNQSSILDEATIQPIGTELMSLAERCEHRKLLLNFENVRFMSSAMLGKLMQLNKKCKADEITLKLSNVSKEIMEIFTMTRLNKVLDLYKDEEKAIKAFSKKGFFS